MKRSRSSLSIRNFFPSLIWAISFDHKSVLTCHTAHDKYAAASLMVRSLGTTGEAGLLLSAESLRVAVFARGIHVPSKRVHRSTLHESGDGIN